MNLQHLKPGDKHYKAYVGPPLQYDFMGASQFRLLCALGLREDHYLLDFGCGSLRAGRLFLVYLNEGRYFGVEPNKWLIDDAIKNQIGEDIVRTKKPQFDYNSDFLVNIFDRSFDFILAQSVFSHAGEDIIKKAFLNFKEILNNKGIIAATFVEGNADNKGKGWVYPECVSYRTSTIEKFADDAGLYIMKIPWYHPRQSWFVLAKAEATLPTFEMAKYLTGATLRNPEFNNSWKSSDDVYNRKPNILEVLLAKIRLK